MRIQRYAPGLIAAVMLGGCARVIGIEDLPDVPVSLDDAAPGLDGAPDARIEVPDAAAADAAVDAGDEVDLTRGLLAHWPLDAIAGEPVPATPDIVRGLDGQVFGSATIVPGTVDGALSLDGANGFVRIDDVPELDITGTITLAAWCRPRATNGIRNIVVHGSSTTPDGEVYLRIVDGEYQGGSWTGTSSEAKTVIPDGDVGNWVHLAGVYDGATWRLYRNGIEVATGGDVGAVTVDEAWAIGARGRASPDRFFEGEIDDVRIYDRPLSPAEVFALVALQPQ